MSFKIILILFSSFFANHLIGQNGTPNFVKFTKTLEIEITDEIFAEAESKGIDTDRIFIGFEMTSDCQIVNFKIVKSGVLKNFNLEVEKQKNKIIKQIKEKIKCSGEKLTSYLYPININI